jgi:hypothetical protein
MNTEEILSQFNLRCPVCKGRLTTETIGKEKVVMCGTKYETKAGSFQCDYIEYLDDYVKSLQKPPYEVQIL